MSQLAHTFVSSGLDTETTVADIKIRIQGLPEDVQWIADALEIACPGMMDWQNFGTLSADGLIEVNGIGQRYNTISTIELS